MFFLLKYTWKSKKSKVQNWRHLKVRSIVICVFFFANLKRENHLIALWNCMKLVLSSLSHYQIWNYLKSKQANLCNVIGYVKQSIEWRKWVHFGQLYLYIITNMSLAQTWFMCCLYHVYIVAINVLSLWCHLHNLSGTPFAMQ